MNKRALFVLAALILILVAPAALLAEEGGNACDSSGAENRPEGKGPDCPDPEPEPEPEPEETQQSSGSTTAETTSTSTTQTTTASVGASQSEQGSESSQKGGTPQEGTRGNAQDNDPGGQDPPPVQPTLEESHAADDNKGFICDENPGIGDGNPAHNPVCVQGGKAAPAPTGAPRLPRTGINALASTALALQLIVGGFTASILGARRSSFTIEIDW